MAESRKVPIGDAISNRRAETSIRKGYPPFRQILNSVGPFNFHIRAIIMDFADGAAWILRCDCTFGSFPELRYDADVLSVEICAIVNPTSGLF